MPLEQKPSAQLKQPETPVAPTVQGSPVMAPSPMQIEQVLESIAQYKNFGKALKRDKTMQEVGTQLAQIAELAEQAVVNEAGDWYDAHTVKRNMKEIKGYAGEFSKLAEEADVINQRMTALYDDMGRVLERYFEIPDELIDPAEVPGKSQDGISSQDGMSTVDGPQKLKEGPSGEKSTAPMHDAQPSATAGQLPDPKEHEKAAVDKLTLKAIKLVHDRLKQKNPEMAKRFASLPARKQIDVVWKIVE